MKIQDLKVHSRLMALLSVFLLGFSVFGLVSLAAMQEVKVKGPVYERIVETKDLVADILPPPLYILESYLVCMQIAFSTDQQAGEQLEARLRNLQTDYQKRHAYWGKQALESDLSSQLLKNANAPVETFFAVAFDKLIPATREHDRSAVEASIRELDALYEIHRKSIDASVAIANKRTEADETLANNYNRNASLALVAVFLTSIALSVVVTLVIVRSIVGPMQQACDISERITAGDLTLEIHAQGSSETAKLLLTLKSMQESLIDLVARVRGGSENVALASAEIAQGNTDLSYRTEEQASALQETAASMDQLRSRVAENAENAQRASELAWTTASESTKGGAMVSQVVNTMKEINESAQRIAEIVGVIDAIAFQTNILALNAAVEAARAGEHGRGFAVVASEVRSLASKSASAAKEIKLLIQESVQRVAKGNALVDSAGTTIGNSVKSIQVLTDIMQHISDASRDQSRDVEQVSEAINQMDMATQQNSALVEQTAAAATSLRSESEDLVNSVMAFQIAA